MPDISIIICTLHRPQQLKDAVLSCLSLRLQDGYEPEIVVVDNSPEANVADLVRMLAAEAAVIIRYVHERRTSIAYARNAGIAASQSPFIAFVDDDMRLPPLWLSHVMRTMIETDADALVGAVEPIAEHSAQFSDARLLDFYRRDLRQPEDSPIKARRSGHIRGVGTGNSVFRRATVITYSQPFDPAFGNGGEDTDFFIRLGRRKLKVVWSAQSFAYEVVSPRRATLSFMAHRTFLASRNYAWALIKNSRRRLMTALILTGIGAVQGIGHSALYAILLLVRSDAAEFTRLSAARGFGKIPWIPCRSSWWGMSR